MPLALLKFPYLIQERIVKEMKLSPIVMLSLCSFKTKKMIELVKYKVHKLCYIRSRAAFIVQVGDPYSSGAETILEIGQVRNENLPSEVRPNDSLRFWTRFVLLQEERNNDEYPTMEVVRIRKAIQKAFQTHLNDLFHYTETNHLYVNIESCPDKLPKIKNVSDSYLWGEKVDISVMENFLKKYSNHQSINMCPVLEGDLQEDLGIFKVPNIRLQYQSGSLFLEMFTGRNLSIYNTVVENSDVVNFLKKWISNEAYHNLETLSIRMDDEHYLEPEQIFNEFVFDEYDPLQRPDQALYDQRIIGRNKFSIPLKTNLAFKQIRRISDNRRAFMQCYFFNVLFFVCD